MNENGLLDNERFDRAVYDNANEERLVYKEREGISEDVVRRISKDKNEPEWMLNKRLEGYKQFLALLVPTWGPKLDGLDLKKIHYYMRSDAKKNSRSWDDVPADIRATYEKLGIPQAERHALAGVGAQYESDVVYHNLKKEWEDQGVVFLDCDEAVQKFPELIKKYFMTSCVPINLHKYAALHAAVWSGGTFIYIPKGVKVSTPLQAYFRMNASRGGQFEHTLIIVDEGAEVQYIEGCFTKGNIVTSNPDYREIESITEHESVLTSEGAFRKTKDIQCTPFSGDIYTIEIYGDSTQNIEVTSGHPFLYVDRSQRNERNKTFVPRWNVPQFFKKGDYLVVPINKEVRSRKKHVFEITRSIHGKMGIKKIPVPLTNEFFRLVGYYLAEGSVSSNSYLNFSFGSHEREYIEDVKLCLKKVFGVEKALEMHHEKNNGTSVVVYSVDLARVFKHLGTSCDTKMLPSWMMYETVEHQREIIKCWFRGDGNYFNKKSATSGWIKELFRINTTSEKLVRQGRDILLRLGVVAFLNKRDRLHDGRRMMYTLGITGDHLAMFGNIVGISVKATLNNKRRASMFGINDKFAFLPIKRITKRSVTDLLVYNFGVEDHETYTVGGVAVHNCSAPQYTDSSLHAGCVEIHVLKGARARYSSIENWSKNTYNLNTKRAIVHEDGIIEWVNGNMGSQKTMLYPTSILLGDRSRSDYLGVAFAGPGQDQDTGSKAIHVGKHTSSTIIAKGISQDGGTATYRGQVTILAGAQHSISHVECDGLMINASKNVTLPYIDVHNDTSQVTHEASVGKIDEEQLFYLTSKGIDKESAKKMIVNGFIEPIIKQLPLEYAVELNRLIELEIEGAR